MQIMDTVVESGALPHAAPKNLRADAQRNRARLLVEARAVFADKGVDAPLEEIARNAEVGIGTLYRHFPTRLDLVSAIYVDEVEALIQSAGHLLAEEEPMTALREWLERFVDYVATKRGLAGALQELRDSGSAALAQAPEQIRQALDALLAAAQESGEVRPDVQAADVVRALGGICMLGERTAADREQTRRIIDLLVDGLRFGAPAAD